MVYLLVGLGGAAGSLLRYLLGNLLLGFNPEVFPFGTLFANMAGSFFLGLLTETWLNRKIPAAITSAIGTGVIGSFTTFSAFSVETVGLVTNGHYFLALLYLFLSGIGGLVFAWLGMNVNKRKGERG